MIKRNLDGQAFTSCTSPQYHMIEWVGDIHQSSVRSTDAADNT